MSETKPALTNDVWDTVRKHTPLSEGSGLPGYGPHGTAAICLYGQPFGFDWGHVVDLEVAIGSLENQDAMDPLAYKLKNIRDLIAALLPPRVS